MFSIIKFAEFLESQDAMRGEIEGGKAPRLMIGGIWKTLNEPLSRQIIEAALLENLAAPQKRELEKSEGRFWFRCESEKNVWMVRVEWKSIAVNPVRRLTFVSQAATLNDPIEAAETAGLSSASKMQEFKSSAPRNLAISDRLQSSPRHVEQMRDAARQIPLDPPPLAPQTTKPQPAAFWESEAPQSSPPPLPTRVFLSRNSAFESRYRKTLGASLSNRADAAFGLGKTVGYGIA